MADIGTLAVKLVADSGRFNASLKGAEKQVGIFQRSLTSMRGAFDGIGSGMAGGLGFAAVLAAGASQIKAAISGMMDLADQSDRFAASIQDVESMRLVFASVGEGAEKGFDGVEKLNEQIGAAMLGSAKAKRIFDALGVSAEQIAGKSALQQITAIADGYQNLSSNSERARVRMQLFGDGAETMNKLLMKSTGELQKLTIESQRFASQLDSATIAKVDELGDALAHTAEKASVLRMAFVAKLAPGIIGFLDELQSHPGSKVLETLANPEGVAAEIGARSIMDAILPKPDLSNKIVDRSAKAAALQKSLTDAAETLRDSLQTPLQKYEEKLGEIDTLLGKGAIDQDTYNAALAKMTEELQKADPAWQSLTKQQERAAALFEELQTPTEKFKAGVAELEDLFWNGSLSAESLTRGVSKLQKELADSDGSKKFFDDMKDRGEDIFKNTRTQAEKFAESIAELNKLHVAGAIDFDTYGRAVKQARGELASFNAVAQAGTDMHAGLLDFSGTLGQQSQNFNGGISNAMSNASTLRNTGPQQVRDPQLQQTNTLLQRLVQKPTGAVLN